MAELRRREIWLALAITALLIAPNIYWNVTHGFATLRHTGDNIQGGGFHFNVLPALEFLVASGDRRFPAPRGGEPLDADVVDDEAAVRVKLEAESPVGEVGLRES